MDLNENNAYDFLQEKFNDKVRNVKEDAKELRSELDNAFDFVERAYGDGNEMLLIVTEFTVNRASAKFIAENGCDKYYNYNKKLMLDERNTELLDEIKEMERLIKAAAEEENKI